MEWIKIDLDNSETYPPIEVSVLVRFTNGSYFVAKMQDDCDYGLCFADFESYFGLSDITHYCLITAPHQPKLVWQRSTKQMPDIWITSTDEEHSIGQHLSKFNWRQKEI